MEARALLTALYRAAVAAVDPALLVAEAVGKRGDAVFVRPPQTPSREFVFVPNRVALLALGKASVAMAHAASHMLAGRITEALVIAPEYSSFDGLPPNYRTMAATHPVPSAKSADAAAAALSLVARLEAQDLLLVLLSGGGSALMCAPAEGIALEEKARTISLLSAAGAPIRDINLVRGALSRVKGGRLALAAGGADVVTLVLSDLGDDGWHLVASGPSVGLPPSRREAYDILSRYRLLPLIPAAVRGHLDAPGRAEDTPLPGPLLGHRWSVLLGDIRTALEGARHEAHRLGADARVIPELLTGEARSAARRLALAGAAAGNLVRRPGAPERRLVTIFGGETTVTVKGDGRGGRNRELALAAAAPIAGVPGACILVAGTDGVDHEADAAGAFVDDTTLRRAEAQGLDAVRALVENDTAPFFAALGDAFSPGPTGTNVGDVAFVLAPGGEPAGTKSLAMAAEME
ncbi:MAG: DUF4147 domain-containing protein [Acidobacteria bacterium]|nr:DUF4147 domain-containing protein [Acidobacteriota bacterium]